MNAPLSPCPVCSRHVKVTDTRCPFCECALPSERTESLPSSASEPLRLSRSAMLLAGAALAVGCDRYTSTAEVYGSPPPPPSVVHAARDASALSSHVDASADVSATHQGSANPAVK